MLTYSEVRADMQAAEKADPVAFALYFHAFAAVNTVHAQPEIDARSVARQAMYQLATSSDDVNAISPLLDALAMRGMQSLVEEVVSHHWEAKQ
ncbi:hypothetical protein [Luteimonas sp. e5]